MKVSISPDDIKDQVTHAGPDYQGLAKLSDFGSLMLPWRNCSLILSYPDKIADTLILRWQNYWYPYLTLRKLLIPLSYPEKIVMLILPWQNCYAYLTLTGPFPGRWPRLICFPGRLVGLRWFLGGRWVVSRGRARNWKDRCHCLGVYIIVTSLCFLKNLHLMFFLDYLI